MKLSTLGSAAALLAACSLILTTASADTAPASKAWKAPRMADGHPDLQGTWTNATITRLERPAEFGDRLALTTAEVKKLEGAEQQLNASSDAPTDPKTKTEDLPHECGRGFAGAGCGYNNFWVDPGTKVAVVNGQPRTSLIVDPATGHFPPLTAERKKYMESLPRVERNTAGIAEGPESRSLGERCILGFGSTSGPPMLPVLYNNHYEIVQNKDTVMVMIEMVHDARIVRIGGHHPPSTIRKFMGDSIGRWEGDTLVIETTNFTDLESFRGSTPDRKVTERLTRVGPNEIDYRVTIDDPKAYTQAWTAEIPFRRTDDKIYEYACHEGNYALPGILAGAREAEKEAAAAAKR
jgi:hypothetical protein